MFASRQQLSPPSQKTSPPGCRCQNSVTEELQEPQHDISPNMSSPHSATRDLTLHSALSFPLLIERNVSLWSKQILASLRGLPPNIHAEKFCHFTLGFACYWSFSWLLVLWSGSFESFAALRRTIKDLLSQGHLPNAPADQDLQLR